MPVTSIHECRAMMARLAHHIRPLEVADIVERPSVRIFIYPRGGYLEEMTKRNADGGLKFRFPNAIEMLKQRAKSDFDGALFVVDANYFHHPVYPEPGAQLNAHQILVRADSSAEVARENPAVLDAERLGYTVLARVWQPGTKPESWPIEAVIATAITTGCVPMFLKDKHTEINGKLNEIAAIVSTAKGSSRKAVNSPFSRLLASFRS